MELKKVIAGLSVVAFVLATGTAVLADTSAQGATTASAGVVDQSQIAGGAQAAVEAELRAAAGIQADTQSPDQTHTDAQSDAGATAQAQTGAPADPQAPVGVAPDSIWYRFKLFLQRVQVILTFDAAKKAQLLMDQAQQRLAEAQAMSAQGKPELAAQAMTQYNQTLNAAAAQAKAAAKSAKDLTRLIAQIDKHRPQWAQVMAQVVAAVPAEQQEQLAQALGSALLEAHVGGKHAAKDAAKDAATDAAKKGEKEDEKEDEHKAAQSGALLQTVSDPATAQAMLQAGVPDRTILSLDAIARQSGKPLAGVFAQFQVDHGLGKVAKNRGLRADAVAQAVEPVMAQAQAEARLGKSGDHGKSPGEGQAKVRAQGKGGEHKKGDD